MTDEKKTEKKPWEKPPWEMTPDEIGEMCKESLKRGRLAEEGAEKRFEAGEGVEDVVDDSALDP